jgi:hypothetical protein
LAFINYAKKTFFHQFYSKVMVYGKDNIPEATPIQTNKSRKAEKGQVF